MVKSAVDGSLNFDTKVDSKGFNNGLNNIAKNFSTGVKGVSKGISSINNKLNALKNTIMATFSFVAVTSALKSLTESSASVKAMGSQYEQTFGDMSASAKKAIQDVAKTSGIVETRLKGVGTSIYAFAKTTGMDSVTALNMMQEALQITADSAAYYDRSLEDTAESLKSFLKGNYENDSALGLSCTETTRNAMANKLYGKSFQELSESQKQLALLQMVKEANQLSGAMGQASREADGWENVTGNLKESWKQLLAVVGQPVLQVATHWVKYLTSALQRLTGYAQQAVNAMYEVFGWKKDSTTKAMANVSNSANNATESIEETTEANEKLKQSLAGFDKLNVLSQNEDENSDTTAPNISSMPTAVSMQDIDTTPLDKFYNKFKTTFDKIKTYVTTGNFTALGSMIAGKFNSLLDNIDWDSIQNKAREWTTNITGFLNGSINDTDWYLVGSTLGEGFNTILTSAYTFVTTFDWSGFGSSLANQVNGAIDTIDWDTLAQTLSKSLLGMLDTAIIFFNETDWNALGESLAEFLVNIDWVSLYKKVNYDLFSAILSSIWDLWCGLLDGLGITEYWANLFLNAWYGIQNAWKGVTNFFSNTWKGIKEAFGSVGKWFKNTFKEAWEGVKNVFTTGGKVFEGIKEGISSVFATVVNGLIDGINTVIAVPFNTINGMLNMIRDFTVPFTDIQPFVDLWSENPLPVPQIPKLATGTVVPANYGEFTAILGDNKREPEIVSPLSTMKQALKEVIEEIGIYPNDNGDTVIVLELDGDVVFKKVVKRNNQYKKRHGGKSAFASS